VGPNGNGTDVTIRVGTVLLVTPPSRAGGWQVAHYPSTILRVTADLRPAVSQRFIAFAVGEAQVTLVATGTDGRAADSFTIHVRVLEDLTRRQQP
jgi:hypothetical protein